MGSAAKSSLSLRATFRSFALYGEKS